MGFHPFATNTATLVTLRDYRINEFHLRIEA
jgi:hypothetical protein